MSSCKSLLVYGACQHAKSYHDIFFICVYVSGSFRLLFSDVWGPAPRQRPLVSLVLKKKYYLIFVVQCYRRFSWLFPIPQKSDFTLSKCILNVYLNEKLWKSRLIGVGSIVALESFLVLLVSTKYEQK